MPILILFLALAQIAAFAKPEPVLSNYLVVPPNDATMRKVADRFEVHHRHGNGFEVIVPAKRAKELLKLVPGAKLLEADISAQLHALDDSWMAGYHDFDSVQEHLKRIVAENPGIAKLEQYGKSEEGHPLYVLKISDNVDQDEAEPELLITAATHGDELITVEVLFGILDTLLAKYKKEERFTKMVDERELFFIPVVSPDGYTKKSRYANGVDPNREYPWPENPTRNVNAAIQAEIDWFHKHDIKGNIDYHAAGGIVMHPWSYTEEKVPSGDEKVFADVCRSMAETNGYRHGQISHVLYFAKGGSVDYWYWKNKTIAIAVEIGRSKAPPSHQIAGYVEQNLESTWRFIEYFR